MPAFVGMTGKASIGKNPKPSEGIPDPDTHRGFCGYDR